MISVPQWGKSTDRILTIVMAAATVVCLGIVARSAYRASKVTILEQALLPEFAVSIAGAITDGPADAPIVLVIYSDYLCPACREFAINTIPTIRATFVKNRDIRIVYRHYPAKTPYDLSRMLSESGACASRQGRFWEMHDAYFNRNTRQVSPAATHAERLQASRAALREMASNSGLDLEEYDTCMKGQTAADVERDIGSALPFDLKGTPSFLIGQNLGSDLIKVVHRNTGAMSLEELTSLLKSYLPDSSVSGEQEAGKGMK
jgi:protein-disulfide isomerase